MDGRTKIVLWVSLCSAFLIILYIGCSGVGINQVYVNPNMNFNFIKKVAVLPFDNLSQDRFAGKKFREIFVTTLLASETIDVPELGDVMKALQVQGMVLADLSLPGQEIIPEPSPLIKIKTDSISSEMAKNIGQALGVQGIILGTVDEFSLIRSTSGSYPEVSVTMRMIDPMTGSIIWSISHSEKGSLVLPSILGIGEETLHETAIKASKKIVNTLVYKKAK